jgi:hypothetical protein
LDIFEQTASTNEPIEELVKKELLVLGYTNLMLRTSNVIFNGGKNMKQCFLQLVF